MSASQPSDPLREGLATLRASVREALRHPKDFQALAATSAGRKQIAKVREEYAGMAAELRPTLRDMDAAIRMLDKALKAKLFRRSV